MAMFKRRRAQGKKEILNFKIDCSIPLEDGVFELVEFTDFLKSSIKVNGKKGNLGTTVAVAAIGLVIVVAIVAIVVIAIVAIVAAIVVVAIAVAVIVIVAVAGVVVISHRHA